MRTPRHVLLPTWFVLSVVAYYLAVFSSLDNYYHGGTVIGKVVVDSAVVFAAFLSWEVLRTERSRPVRILAAVVGFPLVCLVLLTIWFGVSRYVAV